MKKVMMFLAAIGFTLSLSSCFGPDMFCEVDPLGPDVVVIHDGTHHPTPVPHHFDGPGYRW